MNPKPRTSGRAPGRHHRRAIGLIELFERFPDEAAATLWFEEAVWPEGRVCPRCGSDDTHAAGHNHMPYRCRACRRYFGVKTATAIGRSKVPLRKWVLAIYLEVTSLKGVSSMKLHRDLSVTQKTAWFMLHRIREGLLGTEDDDPFTGAVEADESYFGGYRRGGQGGRGKAVVAAVRERDTKRVRVAVVPDRKKRTLRAFVRDNVDPRATLYTDELKSYLGAVAKHERVNHSAGRYVVGMASVNGVESFWATLKRAYHGTYHKVTNAHLERYVVQFAAKHNIRDRGTDEQMRMVVAGMVGRRVRHRELVAAT